VEESVHVHNVSPGGALIEVPWAPPVDTRYTVRLESDHHLSSVTARVCHVRQAFTGPAYLVGLQFFPSGPDHSFGEVERLLERAQTASGDPERV
jgi:hypothetical protein